MGVSKRLNLDGGSARDLAQSTIPSSDPALPNETSVIETKLPSEGTLSVLLSLTAIISLLLLVKRLVTWKPTQERLIHFRDPNSASCSKCTFFNKNPYLKCAVHPSTVLKTEAKDCPDYSEKGDDRSAL